MNKSIKYFFLLTLTVCINTAFGQTSSVSGQVTDVDGNPLIGANILVGGTNLGSATDG